MSELMSQEELEALKLLSKNHRLLVSIVPDKADDEFMARFTAWQNFVLDTMLLPPLFVPATDSKSGDGLVCPFCGGPASQHLDMHAPDCEWRAGAMRYGATQLQIAEEFPHS